MLLYSQKVKKLQMSPIKFAIPKGSLEEATFKLLEKSWTKVNRKNMY